MGSGTYYVDLRFILHQLLSHQYNTFFSLSLYVMTLTNDALGIISVLTINNNAVYGKELVVMVGLMSCDWFIDHNIYNIFSIAYLHPHLDNFILDKLESTL